jgi:hypothetical protein
MNPTRRREALSAMKTLSLRYESYRQNDGNLRFLWNGIFLLVALLLLLNDRCICSSAWSEEKGNTSTQLTRAQGLYPGMFIFGDSLVDNGNNNFLTLTLARADYPPNGIDFGSGWPTGRFCNGKTVADYIGA